MSPILPPTSISTSSALFARRAASHSRCSGDSDRCALRRAAKAYAGKGVVFAKVNADTAAKVSAHAHIEAYPTFKVYKGGQEVAVMKGWGGTEKLKAMIEGAR